MKQLSFGIILLSFLCAMAQSQSSVYPCGDSPTVRCQLLRRPSDLVIYDPDRNITWIRDANTANTLGNFGTGLMTREEALNFIQYINTNVRPAGKSDWRLPKTNAEPDPGCSEPFNQGYGCTQSEFGNLYYTILGNKAGNSQGTGQPWLVNPGMFFNIEIDRGYWTEWNVDSMTTNRAVFHWLSGHQRTVDASDLVEKYYVWLVRDGDTAPLDFRDHADGTVTDTMSGLMWLKDGSYMKTTGAGENGKMAWEDAVNWAASLVVNGYDDWRLPKTLENDPDCQVGATQMIAVHCRGSEMGHLYWNQGVSVLTPGPFVNVPGRGFYNWSGTAWSEHPDQRAWVFEFHQGQQGAANHPADFKCPAWPVRDPQPSDTPTGNHITVTPISGVSISFPNVSAGGATKAAFTSEGPSVGNRHIRFIGRFCKITSTATFTTPVSVCLSYPEGVNPSDLMMVHFNGREWEIPRHVRINREERKVCGEVMSLSWFALAKKQVNIVQRIGYIIIIIILVTATAIIWANLRRRWSKS